MSTAADPLVRRILFSDRAYARKKRRLAALLAYLDTNPDAARSSDSVLRRLDDLLGEADRLRKVPT